MPKSLGLRLVRPSTVAARNISALKWNNKWIDEQAELIMAKAYSRHNSLGDRSTEERPKPTIEELESLGEEYHYKPITVGDSVALGLVSMLRPFTHWFFKDKYNHHAVVLETVAAVPGMVGGFFRHLRSLRRMYRDNGWIHPLLEEAENERMHLLIWMKITQPSMLERYLVMGAQGFYCTVYTFLYMLFPRIAHRFVGYLEEEAVKAYTSFLGSVDSGKIANVAAPDIAKKYYKLDENATIRDVILYVRADECMHRCMNHRFSEMIRFGHKDTHPNYPPVS
jgi:ubiquinol oxidase